MPCVVTPKLEKHWHRVTSPKRRDSSSTGSVNTLKSPGEFIKHEGYTDDTQQKYSKTCTNPKCFLNMKKYNTDFWPKKHGQKLISEHLQEKMPRPFVVLPFCQGPHRAKEHHRCGPVAKTARTHPDFVHKAQTNWKLQDRFAARV